MKHRLGMLPFLFFLAAMTLNVTARGTTGLYPAADLPLALKEWKLSLIVQLSPAGIYRLTGQKMNIQQKVSFALLKGKMKKALRKNPGMTLGEFMVMNKTWNTVLWILLGVLVLMLILVIALFNQLPD